MNPFVRKFLGALLIVQLMIPAVLAQTAMNLGKLPLWFEACQGRAEFMAAGRDSVITISSTDVQFVLRKSGQSTATTQMEFVGGNLQAEILGGSEMTGKVNYLIGNDPARWRSGVAAFGQVRVNQIYPGVNVVYYGNQQRLEYDFNLAPGAKPETIALRFAGADKIAISPQGELIVQLAGREIVQHQPVAYQMIGQTRHEIKAGYKMVGTHTVAFSIGDYDSRLPLVIDPVLSYSTFFGGNNLDIAWAIALDAQTNVYIAGQTLSANLPVTNAFQNVFQGGSQNGDAFVAKFDKLGTNLLYCTYLGGSSDDVISSLAVDAMGHVFAAGVTVSANFPVKNPVVYGSFNGSNIAGQYNVNYNSYPSQGFVSELETNGSSLIYSTYFGGSSYDTILGVAVDLLGDAYITGFTYSTDFPVTSGAYQTNHAFLNNQFYAYRNAFVSEIAAGGNTLNYSSYLGGINVDTGNGISVAGNYVTIVGATTSTNFPTTNFIKQPFLQTPFFQTNGVGTNAVVITNLYSGGSLNGPGYPNLQNDAFVASFTISGTSLVPRYITLLGGINSDLAYGVAGDAAGNAYVVGGSTSPNFPNTAITNQVALTSYVRTNSAITNAFLTQVKWSGSNAFIGYSQLFGGPGADLARGVALDAAANIFVVGSTTSASNVCATTTNLLGSLKALNTGANDIFVTVFKADFSGLLYSADLGGASDDIPCGIAVDAAGNAYITGETYSVPGFPVFNARQPLPAGNIDAFLTKIWLNSPALPVLAANRSATNVLVTWSPVPLAQFTTNSLYLVTATNLLSPATNWTAVPQTPIATNNVYYTNSVYVTNNVYLYNFPATNQTRFFRLQGH